MQGRKLPRRSEKPVVAIAAMHFQQFAPGTDMIFRRSCDAASEPGPHHAVHESLGGPVAKRVGGAQQATQRDRLPEPPDPEVPPHGGLDDTLQHHGTSIPGAAMADRSSTAARCMTGSCHRGRGCAASIVFMTRF